VHLASARGGGNDRLSRTIQTVPAAPNHLPRDVKAETPDAAGPTWDITRRRPPPQGTDARLHTRASSRLRRSVRRYRYRRAGGTRGAERPDLPTAEYGRLFSGVGTHACQRAARRAVYRPPPVVAATSPRPPGTGKKKGRAAEHVNSDSDSDSDTRRCDHRTSRPDDPGIWNPPRVRRQSTYVDIYVSRYILNLRPSGHTPGPDGCVPLPCRVVPRARLQLSERSGAKTKPIKKKKKKSSQPRPSPRIYWEHMIL